MEVGKPFAVFFRDIKDDPGIVPLTLVFRKPQLAAEHMPDNFLARNKFCDLLFGTVLLTTTHGRW
jgi:hypothetical protein